MVELLEGRMAFTPVHAVPVQFRTQAAHTVKPRRQLLRRRKFQMTFVIDWGCGIVIGLGSSVWSRVCWTLVLFVIT